MPVKTGSCFPGGFWWRAIIPTLGTSFLPPCVHHPHPTITPYHSGVPALSTQAVPRCCSDRHWTSGWSPARDEGGHISFKLHCGEWVQLTGQEYHMPVTPAQGKRLGAGINPGCILQQEHLTWCDRAGKETSYGTFMTLQNLYNKTVLLYLDTSKEKRKKAFIFQLWNSFLC